MRFNARRVVRNAMVVKNVASGLIRQHQARNAGPTPPPTQSQVPPKVKKPPKVRAAAPQAAKTAKAKPAKVRPQAATAPVIRPKGNKVSNRVVAANNRAKAIRAKLKGSAS